MSEHSTTVCVIICGQDRKLTVDFTVTSWGMDGSYFDPPEPAEFEIDAIRDKDTGRDMYAFCEEVRDLWGAKRYAGESYWHIGWNNKFTFNAHYYDQTLMQSIMDDIADRINDFIPEPEPDYDYYDRSDYRGEYDV